MKSHDGIIRFDEFMLDPANRRLLRGDTPVDLGGRYFDALVMLVRECGQLVSKDRLHDEVWRGVPVTDEALSQAIMALRRALGDDAAHPRFIETIPRHGYRFVGVVENGAEQQPSPERREHGVLPLIAGGVVGATAAGLLVGLVYGMIASGSGAGNALSLVGVLLAVSVLSALVSGFGIAGGVGLALHRGGTAWWRPLLGGAVGGLVVGGFAKLLGTDTLRLLMGSAPDQMAGAVEGLAMGAIVGLGVWFLSQPRHRLRHGLIALLGAVTGAGLVAGGGTLMAGSLAALVTQFPGAGLSMAWTRDPLWLMLSAAFEGGAFAALVSAGLAAKMR